jgi:hypothetical protein
MERRLRAIVRAALSVTLIYLNASVPGGFYLMAAERDKAHGPQCPPIGPFSPNAQADGARSAICLCSQ